MTAFTVRQESFEGPLDLLLTLIERRQFHINDVALARVSEDFLAYASSFSDFPLAESAQFAYVASTLLLIKSKALLPQLSLSKEEEQSIEELELRLALLKHFRELSLHLKGHFCKSPCYLPLERETGPVFAPSQNISPPFLLRAVQTVLASIPKPGTLPKIAVRKVISLEQMIERLKERITSALRMSFREFSGAQKSERVNVIVGFLAMLELVKEGLLRVTQETPHGDILMETGNIETPRY